MKWYLLQTHSNCEKAVERSLRENVARAGLEHCVGRVIIPAVEVQSMKNGQKVIEEKKLFPNYIMAELDFNDQLYHAINSIPKFTKFVGHNNQPKALTPKEVAEVFQHIEQGHEKPAPKVEFSVGQSVRIMEGPFSGYEGTVENVNYDRNRLRVGVVIFGRSTPVEIEFVHVEKVL